VTRILAATLLICTACSSPVRDSVPECFLSVLWEHLSPPGSGPFELERSSSAKLSFSVAGAVHTCTDTAASVYWYVNFDANTDAVGEPGSDVFTLPGCHEKLAGAYPKTVIVEALVTEGTLILDPASAEPRVGADGQTVQHLVWTVVVTADAPPDC
jgi:hypothetical protein